jgi:hypothetical protein
MFEPWRELDFIRYAQGLPWDDTLVRLGLSFTDLTDKAILALESGSEEHALAAARRSGPPLPQDAFVQFLDRQSQAGAMSDLRREATTLVERIVRLLAMRMAETQSGMRTGVSSNTAQGRAGRVAIIPK